MCTVIDVNTSDTFLWSSHVTALTLSIIITAFHLNLCLIEQTPAASLIPSSPLCLLVSLHTSVIYLLQQLPNSHQFCKKKSDVLCPKLPTSSQFDSNPPLTSPSLAHIFKCSQMKPQTHWQLISVAPLRFALLSAAQS